MKKMMIFCGLLLSANLFAIDIHTGGKSAPGVDAGGGGNLVFNGGGSTSAVLTDINGGGGTGHIAGGIELLKMERIQGSSKFELKSAKSKLNRLINSGTDIDLAIEVLQLKMMADLKDISEVTLRDGTVIKVEEMVRAE